MATTPRSTFPIRAFTVGCHATAALFGLLERSPAIALRLLIPPVTASATNDRDDGDEQHVLGIGM